MIVHMNPVLVAVSRELEQMAAAPQPRAAPLTIDNLLAALHTKPTRKRPSSGSSIVRSKVHALAGLLRTRPTTTDEASHDVAPYAGYIQQLPSDLIPELKKFLVSALWTTGGTLVAKHRIRLSRTQQLNCVLQNRYAVILTKSRTYHDPVTIVTAKDELLISIYDLQSGSLVKELRVAGLLGMQDCGPELGAAIVTHTSLLFLLPSLELHTACSLPAPDEKHLRLGRYTWMHPIVHMQEWGLVLLSRNGHLYAWNAKTQQLHDASSASLAIEFTDMENNLLGAWSKYLSVGSRPEERYGYGDAVLYELVSVAPQPLFCLARLDFLPPGSTPVALLPGGYLNVRISSQEATEEQVYSLGTGFPVSGRYPAPAVVTAYRSPHGVRVIVTDVYRAGVFHVWLDETKGQEISIRSEYAVQELPGTQLLAAMQSRNQMRVFDPLKDGGAECASMRLHPPAVDPSRMAILLLVDDYCLFHEWSEESSCLLVSQLHVY